MFPSIETPTLVGATTSFLAWAGRVKKLPLTHRILGLICLLGASNRLYLDDQKCVT